MSECEEATDRELAIDRRRHQRWVLITMIGLRFVTVLPIAVISSFFPQEVERWRPVSEASLYMDIITGVFGSTAILGSIASSQWVINDIGTRHLLCLTVFLLGMSTILFGCLDYTNSWPGFISLSVIIRLVQGFAYGLTDVIVYGLGTAASSEQMGLASGLLELSFAIGGASGPAIGGILHKVGGFGLPLFCDWWSDVGLYDGSGQSLVFVR
ncbi:uncharacterized protein LOC134194553 [Corticium candelabrum]|uniref:uncharacterized protein LOC134194553 n=1 Tax=Corticium candelabrum TaxID=121492 RepID=UPI002E25A1A4|nr:uncharacterized protein LOC134194553 [Corticium candelabrum]